MTPNRRPRTTNCAGPRAETANAKICQILAAAVALALCITAGPAMAYNSGSSGADGALNPTVDTAIQLPTSGVLNYTTVNIPAGVKVTFSKNTLNTPVVILTSGDVTIAGTVDVSGKASPDVGTAGDGSIPNDGLPGGGGPGGYDGGQGGPLQGRIGGSGLGPGGGGGGLFPYTSANASGNCASSDVNPGNGRPVASGGAGGGFANQGGAPQICASQSGSPTVGGAYGAAALLPLVGGSGGGGGAGGVGFVGSGGGGGGGALLIASSGTVNVTGSLLAGGGGGGTVTGSGAGASGGGGSGGAIRIIATTISGNGTINAQHNNGGTVTTLLQPGYLATTGGAGSDGRIRLEAETLLRTAATAPIHTVAAPGPIFVSGQPTLSITSVAGVAAPANPTGVADIQFPTNVSNPVTVTVATTGVPPGNTVKLLLTPPTGAIVTATSSALTGSTTSATASASITLPAGASTLQATITYTVIASLGDTLSRYANNERVGKIMLVATLGGRSETNMITVSGKTYPAPAAALLALGG